MNRLIIVDADDAVQVRFTAGLRYPRDEGRSMAPGAEELIEELAMARQRWSVSGPSNYEIEWTWQCNSCLLDGQGSSVMVVNGLPVGYDSDPDLRANSPLGPIEGIFNFLGVGLELGLITDVGFDENDGHPTFFILSTEFADPEIIDIPPANATYTIKPA